MVELIVVILLAAILGAMGVSRFADRSQFDAPSFADQAAAAIRFAQKEAIAQNRDVSQAVYVRFDGKSVSLCYGNASPCPLPVLAPFSVSTDSKYCTSSKAYCIRAPGSLGYSISLGPVSDTTPITLYFDAVGRPYSAGAALASVTTLTVSSGSTTATVNIEPETGYVH